MKQSMVACSWPGWAAGRATMAQAIGICDSYLYRAGVWDIFLPVPAPGLWVEMKAPKGRLTVEQAKWREQLEPFGYRFAVCYSWPDAARAIADHVGFQIEI